MVMAGLVVCIQGHVSFLVSWAHSGWSFVCADLHRAGGPDDRTGGGRGSGGDCRQRRPPGGRHPRRWRTGGNLFSMLILHVWRLGLLHV